MNTEAAIVVAAFLWLTCGLASYIHAKWVFDGVGGKGHWGWENMIAFAVVGAALGPIVLIAMNLATVSMFTISDPEKKAT